MVVKKAVFLDRDGVLNRDRGTYTYRIEDFEVLPGVFTALRQWQERGYELIVITNQGGIAKGLYTPEDVDNVHAFFAKACQEEGIHIAEFWYSPNHDVVSASLDRKPGSLLLERAMYKHGIDPGPSFMIGDRERDIEAGERAGVQTLLVTANGDLAAVADRIP